MHVKSHRINWSILLLIAVFTLLATVIGCGKEKSAPLTPAGSDRAKIQAMYDTAVTRLRNRDKSGLYDIEFEYIKAQFTFADYQIFPQIKIIDADTTDSIRIDSVEFYGKDSARDSAKAWFTAVFKGRSGNYSYLKDQWHICYFHLGRWIHPSVGVIQNQLSFDSLKNSASDAASKESGG